MFAANRAGRKPSDITIGVNHWVVQGSLGLTLIALSAIASVWPRGRRYLGASVGIVASYLSAISFAYPDSAGAPPPPLAGPRGGGGGGAVTFSFVWVGVLPRRPPPGPANRGPPPAVVENFSFSGRR